MYDRIIAPVSCAPPPRRPRGYQYTCPGEQRVTNGFLGPNGPKSEPKAAAKSKGPLDSFVCVCHPSSLPNWNVDQSSVKPRVMTPQSSVNFPKTHLKAAQNSAKQSKKRVLRAVFALCTHQSCRLPRSALSGAASPGRISVITSQATCQKINV